MLPVSAKQPVRFTPWEYSEEAREQARKAGREPPAVANPPVYYIEVPNVFNRTAYRTELAKRRIVAPPDEELFEALREGIHAAAPEAEKAAMLATVDAFEADKERKDPALRKRYARVESRIADEYPPLAELMARRVHFNNMMPVVACRYFLKGGENLPAPIELKAGLVTDETLVTLPADHIEEIGWYVWALMVLSKDQEKNSAPPSPSPSTQPATAEAQSPPTAGQAGNSSANST
jgi:hypothetical protein